MKRKLLCGLLAAASLSLPARAARTVPVQVDNQVLEETAYLEQGVTYVPLRSLLDAMGGWEVSWDSHQKEAVAVSGSTRLTANPAQDTIRIGREVLSGRVTVENGRTYVPLRLLAEALQCTVNWDPRFGGAAVTSAGAEYDAEELYWLSRIICAESGGEPMRGQIAVGNVVLNRVDSQDFPDTIPEVIFEYNGKIQFEPVENGTVYKDPTEQSVEAAKRALDGENTIGDAMYFYAPALSEGEWINANRVYYKTIGCHRFYL